MFNLTADQRIAPTTGLRVLAALSGLRARLEALRSGVGAIVPTSPQELSAMTIWDLVLILAVLLVGAALGAFVTLLAGIRTEERHMSLTQEPTTRAGLATRRLLGVRVRTDLTEYRNDITETEDARQ